MNDIHREILVARTMIMVNHPDANFVITGGIGGCRLDNLQCHQWWQSWHHNYSVFTAYTVYPIKYAHKFCCVILSLLSYDFILDLCDPFTFIIQGCSIGIGATVILPNTHETTLEDMGKNQYQAQQDMNLHTFLGMHCTYIWIDTCKHTNGWYLPTFVCMGSGTFQY